MTEKKKPDTKYEDLSRRVDDLDRMTMSNASHFMEHMVVYKSDMLDIKDEIHRLRSKVSSLETQAAKKKSWQIWK